MNEWFDRLQTLILTETNTYAHSQFRQQLKAVLEEVEPLARAKALPLLRLSSALCNLENEMDSRVTGTADLVVLMRQVIRFFGLSLELPNALWERIRYHSVESGLYLGETTETTVRLYAKAWEPQWLDGSDLEVIDRLEVRRSGQSVVGDGMLAAMSAGKRTTYRSEGQKAALDAVLFAAPGSTLLVTLPTGGGKSLAIVLPAWLASSAGQARGGTSIVVVPTISLAQDQLQHVMNDFPGAVGPQHLPHAWLGSTASDERAVICEGIRAGTLPLLYTSPEALLNNTALRNAVMAAAAQGTLNWLIVDEAHMVELWGAGFRTEFQLLASLRNQLLAQSHGMIRTLLLSATVSERCLYTLTELFGDKAPLATISANQLRPEISYWFSTAKNEEERRQRILDALYNLPRPAILYVTQPKQASEWIDYLLGHGFRRVAAYTGETDADERGRILREWDRNERDLIVATSAFGLGVDKEDVRTVLHAALPENVDRFYQEVGRGGRDGCRSVSLLCTVPQEDRRLARSMSIRSRITVEKARARWLAMWKKHKRLSTPGHYLVNLNAKPNYNPDMDESARHRSWNEHVLLLMQRAKLIQIHDTNPADPNITSEISATAAGAMPDGAPERTLLHIELREIEVASSEAEFDRHFQPHRKAERSDIQRSLVEMLRLSVDYAGGRGKDMPTECLSQRFARVYPWVAVACGGCPVCRRKGKRQQSTKIHVNSEGIKLIAPGDALHVPICTAALPLHIIWEGAALSATHIIELLPLLLQVGFRQFIVPDALTEEADSRAYLVSGLAEASGSPRHRLLTDGMAVGKSLADWPLITMPTVVVYPPDSTQADTLYRHVKRLLACTPSVHVLPRHLLLASEHGYFLERVNGRHERLDLFINRLQRNLETL